MLQFGLSTSQHRPVESRTHPSERVRRETTVDTFAKSVLEQSAIASGLLTADELDEARRALAKSGGEITEERLAARLVESGKINLWQAEQLRRGKTKLNLGPYLIIDEIGQGGMGQVYKGVHTVMGRVVAVKVLPRSKSTPEAIANFEKEVRTQAQLDHEHLVRAYDAGQDGKVHFLVTEYVPGADLRRLVRRRGRLSMNTAAVIITQAALGLEHAHRRALIHRDVKPGNILVTPDARAKVSDLGLADFFRDEVGDPQNTKIVGTADYLAPEQIISPNKLTAASDIYSLGCTLYYCVTGKVPFPGGTTRDKARAHCNMQPIDPRRFAPDLSDAFVDVIADMMTKDPADRIQTAADVVARLSPWSTNRAAAAREICSPAPSQPSTLTAGRRHGGEGGLSDTKSGAFFDLGRDSTSLDGSSEQSIGTWPVAASLEDTTPGLNLPPIVDAYPARPIAGSFSVGPRLLAAIVIVAGILGAMILYSIR